MGTELVSINSSKSQTLRRHVSWWAVTLLVIFAVVIMLSFLGLVYNNVRYWPSVYQRKQALIAKHRESMHVLTDSERRVQEQAVKRAKAALKLYA